MSGHTIGPWQVDKYGVLTSRTTGTVVLEYGSGIAMALNPTDEAIANATLRNAATELLDALELFVAWYDFGIADDVPRVVATARIAIQKARG